MTYYSTPDYGVLIKSGTEWLAEKQSNSNNIYTTNNLSTLQSSYREGYAPSNIKYVLFIEVDSNYTVKNPFIVGNIDDFVAGYQTNPPASEPVVGTKYIVKTTGLQAWAGQDEKLVVYINDTNPYDPTDATQFRFVTPIDGYKVYNNADSTYYTWNDTVVGNWSN